MTGDSQPTWTERNRIPIQTKLDNILARAGEKYYLTLSASLNKEEVANRIDNALTDLELLRHPSSVSPNYDNPWVALFHFLWYQPKQINIAYRAARKLLSLLLPIQENIYILDFGCGSLAMQFGYRFGIGR